MQKLNINIFSTKTHAHSIIVQKHGTQWSTNQVCTVGWARNFSSLCIHYTLLWIRSSAALHPRVWLHVCGCLHQMPPWWQNYSSIPSVFILWHHRSFTSLTLCVCLQTKDVHATDALLVICLYTCEHVCGHVCASILCAVCVTSCHPHRIRHILKVTNQARWPFRKIKDAFREKETLLIYHMTPTAMEISAIGEAALRGYKTKIWAET